MYEFPYGGEQQLNLNWIINEIITLHKRLDPDYELPNFDNAFPYMNLNQLNLDWILRELKAIKDLAPAEDSQLLKMVANALIANTYDAETQYNVDDIVYRDNDNRLYKCITATPAGGEPFDSSKWVEVDVGGVLTDLLMQSTPVQPYDSNPAMDGTASAGTSTQYARGDHVHPKDTARVPTSRTVNGKALSSNITLNASDIPNDSNVTGDNTDDALNNLDNAIDNVFNANQNVLSNVDLNTITDSGIYYVDNGSNFPSGSNGVLIVFGVSSTRIKQFFLRYGTLNSTDMYWYGRDLKIDGTEIGAWYRIPNSGLDLTPEEIATGITGLYAYKRGNIVELYTKNNTLMLPTITTSGWITLGTLPNNLLPITSADANAYIKAFAVTNTSNSVVTVRLSRYDSTLDVYGTASISDEALNVFFTYLAN